MRQKKNPRFKSRPAYAIVVDGECEFWYIRMLKQNEPDIRFGLKPELQRRKTLTEQYNQVIELAADYDKVFWIIDCDVIAGETRLAKKGTETQQQKLEKFCKILEEHYKDKVVVIMNNPCLEYWLLLHFEGTNAQFNNCNDAGKKLKKHLTGYEKSEGFYTKHNNDIYLQLKPHLTKAAARAEHIAAKATHKDSSISQMHLLFEELGLYHQPKKNSKKPAQPKR